MYKSLLFNITWPSLSSLIVMPVIYERNAGYRGSAQGDIKDKKPAPNARKRLTCSKNLSPSLNEFITRSTNIGYNCEEIMQLS